jgi:hypothetical protein
MGRFRRGAWLAGVAVGAGLLMAAFAAIAGPAGATGDPAPQALRASKTAQPSWERTFKWTIDKSVTPDSWSLTSGQSGTSTYTVTLTKSLDSEVVKVSGEVCVENVMAAPTENLRIVDRLQADTGGGFVPGEFLLSVDLDLSANPVLDPGESHCYAYSIPFTPVAGAVGYRNNASVTITNDPRHPGDAFGPNVKADFTLPPPTLINDSVNVDDTNGSSWLFTGSGSQSYTKTFTCDQDAGRHDNTATIRETGQNASASVTVTCTPPPGNEGCTPGFWKNHPEAFAGTGVTAGSTLASVGFNVAPSLTFQQALELTGGGLNALLRHAAAAYLNAASPDVDYPRTTTQVVTATNSAIASGNYETTKNQFDAFNNLNAPGFCD